MFKNYKSIKQKILGKSYNLFVADTPSKKIKGLSGIKSIPRNCGMIFVYGEEKADRSFTMKNVFFKLRIIFLDNDMNVVEQIIARPNQRSIICSKPSMYVIEIPG